MTRHFIELSALTPQDLRLILEKAVLWKKARLTLAKGAVDPKPILAGYSLAMLFEKPSTRTRVSFEAAIHQAGGHALLLENSQMGRGETPFDTAKTLSRMVDMLLIRCYDSALIEAMKPAGLPLINGLTNRSHPCQVMADIMSFETKKGPIKGQTIAWVGDGNNMLHSLVEAAALFEFELRIASPQSYRLAADRLQFAREKGAKISQHEQPTDAVIGAEAVMTDSWVSMGDKDGDARHKAFQAFQVNEALMGRAKKDALFMHCLPAHRGEEVSNAVIDGPQSLVWEQAENRLHVQKAIMAWVLEQI